MSMEQEPKFCRGCRRPMKKTMVRVSWNAFSGEPVGKWYTKCTAPWWTQWEIHDYAELNIFGRWEYDE